MSQLGPCVICGVTNYALSMGGPTICPKCDCGACDSATVELQAKAMQQMRAEIERLRLRVQDAESDVLRLHNEKMALFEKTINQQDSSLREKSDG